MRFILTLAMLGLTLFSVVSAQRVGELRFAVPYQVLPATQLPEAFTTFSTRVSDPYSAVSRAGLTKLGLKNRLKMRNFRSLPSGGHLLVTYKVDRFRTEDVRVRSKTTESKKKDGTVVKSTTYWIEGTYNFTILLEVLDLEGGVVYESVVGTDPQPLRYPTGATSYTSSSQASKAWSGARAKTLLAMQKDLLTKGFNTLNARLLANIDIQEKKDFYYFEYPKGNKAENADLWLEHATAAKELLDTISSDAALPKAYLTTMLQPHVDFWKEQMAANPADNKKLQRYYHCAAFNLATVELALENPGTSQDLSNNLAENVKWNKDRSRAVNQAAASLSTVLTEYPSQSRHFALRDLTSANGPENPTYGMPEPIKPTYDTTAAYVIVNGERKAGSVIIQENVEVKLMGRPNFRFMDGEQQPVAIDVNKIDGFGFGDFDFVVEKWADKGDLLGRPNFMRVLLDGPKMQYLEYYPTYTDAGGVSVEFLKPKDGDLISLSITNARWLNWKKAFAKVFDSCPGLEQRIASGEFSRTTDDIATAVQQFNEGNCELAAESEDDGEK